jgi:hypothetical protein
LDAVVSDIAHRDIMAMLNFVSELGFTEIAVVVGSDRYDDLNRRIALYNGSLYHFVRIEVINAGQRDGADDGVAGMSASKLRHAARHGDFTTFYNGLPSKLQPLAHDIFEEVIKGCVLKDLATSF